jgi:hypothetical protein
LADSGEAGLEIKKGSDGTGLTVINLGELNPKWKEIEDLFSKKDAEFFHVADKKSRNAVALKHRLLAGTYEFSEKTVSNFTKFFEQLQDKI